MKFEDIIGEIRKGRRFCLYNGVFVDWKSHGDFYCVQMNDLLSDQWKLEPEVPKTVTITREDLAKAWDRSSYTNNVKTNNLDGTTGPLFEEFCEELGL